MNEKRNRLAVFFGKTAKSKSADVKKINSIPELKGKLSEIYKEVEDRIEADSQRLDQLGEKRQQEIITHEQAIKNLMERHERILNAIRSEENATRESIQQATAMKVNLAQIA